MNCSPARRQRGRHQHRKSQRRRENVHQREAHPQEPTRRVDHAPAEVRSEVHHTTRPPNGPRGQLPRVPSAQCRGTDIFTRRVPILGPSTSKPSFELTRELVKNLAEMVRNQIQPPLARRAPYHCVPTTQYRPSRLVQQHHDLPHLGDYDPRPARRGHSPHDDHHPRHPSEHGHNQDGQGGDNAERLVRTVRGQRASAARQRCDHERVDDGPGTNRNGECEVTTSEITASEITTIRRMVSPEACCRRMRDHQRCARTDLRGGP